jgi:hypothetical protein
VIHLDPENHLPMWEKIKSLYQSRQLPGIIRIAASFKDSKGSRCIMCFAGPHEDKSRCIAAGEQLVAKINHQRQKCNGFWPGRLYYKMRNVQHSIYSVAYE